jgi:hypothetical protein
VSGANDPKTIGSLNLRPKEFHSGSMSEELSLNKQLWLLSITTQLPPLTCQICRGYIQAMARYSSVLLDQHAEALCHHSPSFLQVDLFLHQSSKLYLEVFDASGLSGQCKSCGRSYRYSYEPRSGEPGRLSIGKTESQRPVGKPLDLRSVTKSKPRVLAPSYQQVTVQQSDDPHSVWWIAEVAGCHLARFHLLPSALWLQFAEKSGAMGATTSTTLALDPESGETLYRCQYEEIVDVCKSVVLVRSGQTRPKLCALDSRTGEALWSSPYQPGQYRSNGQVILFRAEGRSLLKRKALYQMGSSAHPWIELEGTSGVDFFSLSSSLFSCRYSGSIQEVRDLTTGQEIWTGATRSGRNTSLYLDQNGWLFSGDEGVKAIAPDGRELFGWPKSRVMQYSAQWVVCEFDNSEFGIWGGTEPTLAVFSRITGERAMVHRLLDRGRKIVSLDGDLIWCVQRTARQFVACQIGDDRPRVVIPIPSCLKDWQAETMTMVADTGRVFAYTPEFGIVRLAPHFTQREPYPPSRMVCDEHGTRRHSAPNRPGPK